jgi:non-specific serine/threonine protein kinase
MVVLVVVAGLAVAQGRAARAARLFGAVAGVRTATGRTMPEGLRVQYDHDLAAARAALGQAAFAAAWTAGQALTLEGAVAEALAELEADDDAAPATAPAARSEPLSTDGPEALTAREVEVAALVARGLSNHQIAAALSISPRTVSTHLTHVMAKLGLESRVQVATWAVARGLGAPSGQR